MIEDFWTESNEGEIHARDHLQFELKSEFKIHPELSQNLYRQDVFIFIPSTLHINQQTYTKERFYHDQINIIRYKTPSLSLLELMNSSQSNSPLYRIKHFLELGEKKFPLASVTDELKLFGAIYKARVREKVYAIIETIESPSSLEQTSHQSQEIAVLCEETHHVLEMFRSLRGSAIADYPHLLSLFRTFKYIDEILSVTTEDYFLILLKALRNNGEHHQQSDQMVCQSILREKMYRQAHDLGPKTSPKHRFVNEAVLYREGLLKRYILESLRLQSHRFSLEEKHKDMLGAIAAGIAMFIYMGLFVWKSPVYVLNSFPFVALAVVLYILKDRVKEGIKNIYHRQARKWFPDYSTEIKSPKGFKIGRLSENFSFIEPEDLPKGFLHIRNHQFHDELEAMKRYETIIHYKREVLLNKQKNNQEDRRKELTAIFRFNVSHFLEKAGNPVQPILSIDPYTQEITEKMLPKVYHLNIIIQNTFLDLNGETESEIKLFRVVVDKHGIKRVEHLN